jgi:hypothetical protein
VVEAATVTAARVVHGGVVMRPEPAAAPEFRSVDQLSGEQADNPRPSTFVGALAAVDRLIADNARLRAENAELQARVDELTAQRDTWQAGMTKLIALTKARAKAINAPWPPESPF